MEETRCRVNVPQREAPDRGWSPGAAAPPRRRSSDNRCASPTLRGGTHNGPRMPLGLHSSVNPPPHNGPRKPLGLHSSVNQPPHLVGMADDADVAPALRDDQGYS